MAKLSSGCPGVVFAFPRLRRRNLFWRNSLFLRRWSIIQKAQCVLLLNQLCSASARFLHRLAGCPVPISDPPLPVPYGWAHGKTFACADISVPARLSTN